MKAFVFFVLLASTTLAPTVQSAPPVDQRQMMNSVLWVQKALEYRISAEGVYNAAIEQLPMALTKFGTAAPEQHGDTDYMNLPPAVILDIDETVLDNSAYSGWQVTTGSAYNKDSWKLWVSQEQAIPVPGALAFTKAAEDHGVKVFYVTNRFCNAPGDCPAKRHTMSNMAKLGFPRANDASAFLLKNEQPDWQDDKSSRRREIVRTHRVLMLIGDDLKDFLPANIVDQRRSGANVPEFDIWERQFGKRWFLLPNPVYGSWERHLPASLEVRYTQISAADLSTYGLMNHVVPPNRRDLKLATWNMEWLMTPDTYDALKPACKPTQPMSNERSFPCTPGKNPIKRHSWEDFEALSRYATLLDADVIALQEVDGAEPAVKVFGENYRVDCFITRQHPQKTGFAIRNTIPYQCNPEVSDLDVNGAVRSGADITIFPGTANEVRLLSVHLKSGCFRQRLNQANEACAGLQRQVPVLEAWVDARVKEGKHFAILGDFNRQIEVDAKYSAGQDEANPLNLVGALSDNDPVGAVLVRATEGADFIPCSILDEHDPNYIDSILLSKSLADRATTRLFFRTSYHDDDARRRILSDHCPTGIILGDVLK